MCHVAGIPAELHVFSSGAADDDKHAQGLAPANALLSGWPAQMLAWLGKEWRPPDEQRTYHFHYTA
jgi:hypothetical protein